MVFFFWPRADSQDFDMVIFGGNEQIFDDFAKSQISSAPHKSQIRGPTLHAPVLMYPHSRVCMT